MGTLACVCLVVLGLASEALALTDNTRESLGRLEEVLKLRKEEGIFTNAQVEPLTVVSLRPEYEESSADFANAALASLRRVFSASAVRLCDLCMAPRTEASGGRLESRSGALSLEEIRALDASQKGDSLEARTAVWLDESRSGVSIRIVDLSNGRVVYADNVTPTLEWTSRSEKQFSTARDLHRRMRGESLTHSFLDIGIYPAQHLSLDWMEQWGEGNENLTGLSFSLFTPVIGLGPTYAKIYPRLWNAMFGGKIMLSLPNAVVASIAKNSSTEIFDPLATVIGYARIPIPSFSDSSLSQYGVFAFVTSSAKIGLGISTLNITFLPVLP